MARADLWGAAEPGGAGAGRPAPIGLPAAQPPHRQRPDLGDAVEVGVDMDTEAVVQGGHRDEEVGNGRPVDESHSAITSLVHPLASPSVVSRRRPLPSHAGR